MSCPLPEKSNSPQKRLDKADTSDYTVYVIRSTVGSGNLEVVVSNSSSLPIYEQITNLNRRDLLQVGKAKASLLCRAAPILYGNSLSKK